MKKMIPIVTKAQKPFEKKDWRKQESFLLKTIRKTEKQTARIKNTYPGVKLPKRNWLKYKTSAESINVAGMQSPKERFETKTQIEFSNMNINNGIKINIIKLLYKPHFCLSRKADC